MSPYNDWDKYIDLMLDQKYTEARQYSSTFSTLPTETKDWIRNMAIAVRDSEQNPIITYCEAKGVLECDIDPSECAGVINTIVNDILTSLG